MGCVWGGGRGRGRGEFRSGWREKSRVSSAGREEWSRSTWGRVNEVGSSYREYSTVHSRE